MKNKKTELIEVENPENRKEVFNKKFYSSWGNNNIDDLCDVSTETFQLEVGSDGAPKPTIDNFLILLYKDKKFGGLYYDEFKEGFYYLENNVKKPWTDLNDAETRFYIEKKYGIKSFKNLNDALMLRFRNVSVNPLLYEISKIGWDGVSRVETILIKWLKCEDTPYVREVTRLIFAGGIHRLMNPGCKFDVVPVLVGTKQGEGKSTFVRWLAMDNENFAEVSCFEGQKSVEALDNAWICEIAELLALSKSKDIEAVKSFLTKVSDRIRRPYEKRPVDLKRKCIFIGTTNKMQFLTDKTGNRRWFPLEVHSDGRTLFEHEEEVKKDIRQAWAEAYLLCKLNAMSPVPKAYLWEEIQMKQNMVTEDDYRVGLIENYLETKEKACIYEIWVNALDNKNSKPTRKDSNEISLIIQSLGYEKKGLEYCGDFGKQMVWGKKKRFLNLY